MRSRLEKYVLYCHRGFAEDLGFTASFKPVTIQFTQTKYAGIVKEGWYTVRKVPNKPKLLVTPDDLTPLTNAELAKLVARMRMRFYKLVNSNVKSDRVAVVKPSDIPLVDTVALLKLRESGKLEFTLVPRIQLASELRGAERVVVSRNGDMLLVVVDL